MALRFSQGVVNAIGYGMGWGDIIEGSTCVVYSGSQPATADTAATAGTELVRFTLSGAALTAATRGYFIIDFTSSTTSCTALTVEGTSLIGGATVTGGSAALIAANVAAAVNSNFSYPDFYAVVGGTTVGSVTYGSDSKLMYVLTPKNSANSLGAMTIACTVGGGSVAINGGSSSTVGGSGAVVGTSATNGLRIQYPSVAGLVTIKTGDSWSGTASATGTAGWFRILCTPNWDTGLTNLATTGDAAQLIMRIDGSVGTSGSDMIVTSTSIASGVSQTVTSFALTVPSL